MIVQTVRTAECWTWVDLLFLFFSTMWSICIFLAVARVSSASVWNTKSDPFTRDGGSPASNSAPLRRRPALESLTAADVGKS